ncbi:ferredoxin--NADP reductase [Olivibacter ginsenosidimutans]|uniref:Ferredoxin--NADP reductase n=1 Tax=Olivibacter ginsenosidimutans TaxID=1176537 RepID=A0ABP9BCD4_9SPHI
MADSLYQLRIISIKEETSDTKSFQLEATGKQAIYYESGQFLTLCFTHSNGEVVRRSYSISSSPLLNEPLTITVKKIPNGEFSRKLVDHAKVGDLLNSMGTSGLFTLPLIDKTTHRHFCFLAAGSGITPIYAHIKTLLFGSAATILLIYSNRNAHSTIFFDELLRLKEQFTQRFVIEFLFSESPLLMESRLSQPVFDILAQKHALYSNHKTLFYLCGPSAYMRMIHIKLRTEGIASENIKKELFVIQAPAFILPEPPDKEEHQVTIHFRDHDAQLAVQYPESILAVAKKNGVVIPYSCENGQCGSCAVKCTHGKVWMRYNEVLGAKALAEGYILTCTGYPIEGPVELML